jgi:arabinose-5-phosphate isomerase
MYAGDDCPMVRAHTPMREVISEMSRKSLGMTCVVDDQRHLLGIITDGDLRRHMERGAPILQMTAADVMTKDPVSIAPETLSAEALNIMERRKITSLVVVADGRRVAGVVHLHHLWRTELV